MEHLNGLPYEVFVNAIDHIYDVVEVWDGNYQLLYTNKSSYRLFGVMPNQLTGKNSEELMNKEQYWDNSTLPYVYENKKSTMQQQKTALGTKILTIAVPILDFEGNVEYVVMTARESKDDLATKLSPVEKNSGAENLKNTGIIYNSAIMKQVMKTANKVAKNNVNCLILGETGTGKSLLAKYIHKNSNRRNEKMITLNMASMNPSVIESELFGYVKGAFTGASQQGKQGLFQVADKGTLFLDEIGELPLALQAKFLHVLQDGEYIPIGGTQPIQVNLNVIAATNCNLEDMVAAGTFREDLFHRLNVIEILMPPIRERGKDLEMMISFYLNQFNQKYHRNCIIDEGAMKHLRNHRWQGNIRELANTIERCVVMADGDTITVDELPKNMFKLSQFTSKEKSLNGITNLHEAMSAYEGEIVRHHYTKNKSTRKLAAALGISQTTAKRMIDEHVNGQK
ncbi:sigma-54 interaction domain-containing protein [Chakrabartyella piscis]|uniref:sigma-54 interaction domain-containing protein n=1 Tax=Chakrabartyella piscis TaxID=2918914 RepID=UPI00295890FE|nr:sigma 54-interacting transcriptional regulator [Chakrabartyella piscis]